MLSWSTSWLRAVQMYRTRTTAAMELCKSPLLMVKLKWSSSSLVWMLMMKNHWWTSTPAIPPVIRLSSSRYWWKYPRAVPASSENKAAWICSNEERTPHLLRTTMEDVRYITQQARVCCVYSRRFYHAAPWVASTDKTTKVTHLLHSLAWHLLQPVYPSCYPFSHINLAWMLTLSTP